jgi:hypothetical protein
MGLRVVAEPLRTGPFTATCRLGLLVLIVVCSEGSSETWGSSFGVYHHW